VALRLSGRSPHRSSANWKPSGQYGLTWPGGSVCRPLAPLSPDYGASAFPSSRSSGPCTLLTILPARRARLVFCHGRLALGRSVHAGVSQPPGRSWPHRPYLNAPDLSSGLPFALDGARPPDPGDPAALAAAPGGRDDGSCRARQGTPARGRRAGGGQDRWSAAVCRGVDQDGAGVRLPPGAPAGLYAVRSPPAASHSDHAA
jgi:hypothetical protein